MDEILQVMMQQVANQDIKICTRGSKVNALVRFTYVRKIDGWLTAFLLFVFEICIKAFLYTQTKVAAKPLLFAYKLILI